MLVANVTAPSVDTAEKSVGAPVVTPLADDTVIVQLIVLLKRAGFVFVHDILDTDVGVS